MQSRLDLHFCLQTCWQKSPYLGKVETYDGNSHTQTFPLKEET